MRRDEKSAVFGTVFMDCKGFAAERFEPLGRNVGSVKFIHGGVGRNVAENLASIGESVSFVSSVDVGALGLEVTSRLEEEGVDVSRVRRAASSGMGLWLAIMDGHGELAASVSQMPDLSTLESIVREEGDEIIAKAKDVMLELDLNDYISKTVVALAKKHGKKVYGVTGNMEVVLRNADLLKDLECYICNETEANRLLTREIKAEDPDGALFALCDYVEKNSLRSMIITLGEYGSVYCAASGERGHCPAVPTRVADSSGAGDAFFSGVAASVGKGLSLKEATRVGSRLASWTIEVASPTRTPFPEKIF